MLAGSALFVPTTVWAQASTAPGTPTAPHPTLENISIVWPVTGDTDNDGTVTVRYRAMGSLEFAKMLVTEAQVAVSPGVGFGPDGDGHVRFALIENEHRTRQAVTNLKRALTKLG